jgi:hypothetical protein
LARCFASRPGVLRESVSTRPASRFRLASNITVRGREARGSETRSYGSGMRLSPTCISEVIGRAPAAWDWSPSDRRRPLDGNDLRLVMMRLAIKDVVSAEPPLEPPLRRQTLALRARITGGCLPSSVQSRVDSHSLRRRSASSIDAR